MATKTFKTRIKLKYDLQSNWNDNFAPLVGEMLLGYDTINGDTRVFANVGVGTGAGDFKPLSILTDNVLIESVNEGAITYQTLTDKLTAIDAALGAGGSVANQITAAIAGLNAGPLQLASVDTDKITIKQIKEENGKISIDETSPIVINIADDYDGEDNKIATVATVTNAVETAKNTLQGSIDTLSGTVNGHTTSIGSLQTTVGEHTTSIGSLQITVQGHGERLTTVEGKANSALQSISKGTDGDFVTTTVSDKGTGTTQTVGVSVTTQTVSNATAQDNGLATAVDVKSYVESKLTGIVGAMVYRGTTTSYPPVASGATKGDVYVASSAFETYEKGDMFIYNGETWDVVNGENQVTVTSDGALITAGGAAISVATVDGTEIPVKVQVTGGDATIATVSDGVVTLKASVAQTGTSGTITQGTGDDITLAKVAKTGAAADVSYDYTDNHIIKKDDVQEAIDAIDGALFGLETNVSTNTSNITNLQGLVGNTAVATQITNAISALDGSATIASVTNDIVTLKAGVTEADGVISNSTAADITLAKVATTGNTDDLEQGLIFVFDCGSATTVIDGQANA